MHGTALHSEPQVGALAQQTPDGGCRQGARGAVAPSRAPEDPTRTLLQAPLVRKATGWMAQEGPVGGVGVG